LIDSTRKRGPEDRGLHTICAAARTAVSRSGIPTARCRPWRASSSMRGARRAPTSGWRIRAAALVSRMYLDISATPHHGGPGRPWPRGLPRGATSPAGLARTGV
jgi:hypothetical protein